MTPENTTTNKKDYIARWNSYIQAIRVLQLTPTFKLSHQVEATLDRLEKLVKKVANDKWRNK